MRFFVGIWLLFLAGVLPACSSTTEPAAEEVAVQPPAAGSADAGEAAVDLFDHATLEGWGAFLSKPGVTMDQVWSVRDGLLNCKGDPVGYLYTQQQFTSFKLEVEWRWAPGTEPGNSGVLMRISGEPRAVPRAIEAQLQSGNAGDVYGFHGLKIDGPSERKTVTQDHELLGDFVGIKKIEANEAAPGEWNRYDIVLDGPKLTVRVNGKQVNEAFDCDVLAGPIGLQSEGGEIEFRTVRLTPLP